MGGSAKKPDDPPPAPAPVRADQVGGEQALSSAGRRSGLRKTILDQNNFSRPMLGATTALGQGGEGAMVNTVVPPPPTGPKNVKGGQGKL